MGVFVEEGNERACPAYGGVCAVQRTHNKDVTGGRKHCRIVLFERPPGHLHTVLVKSNTPGRSTRKGGDTSAKQNSPGRKFPGDVGLFVLFGAPTGRAHKQRLCRGPVALKPTMLMSGLNYIYEKAFKKQKKAVGEACTVLRRG